MNNVLSCLEDFNRISKARGGAPLPARVNAAEIDNRGGTSDRAVVQGIQDRYTLGVLSALPGSRAVVVYGESERVVLIDDQGAAVEGAAASHQDGVAVFIVPADASYRLEIGASAAVEIAVFDDSDEDRAVTRRYTAGDITTAVLDLTPDGAADLLTEGTGESRSIPPVLTTLDVVAPSIERVGPATGSAIPSANCIISASFSDDSGGSGVDAAGVRLLLDGAEVTGFEATASELRFGCADAELGEHTAVVIAPDNDGNAATARWTFTVAEGPDAVLGLLGVEGNDTNAFGMGLRILAAVVALVALVALARGGLGAQSRWLVVAAIVVVIAGGVGARLWIAVDASEAWTPVAEEGVSLAADLVPEGP